MARYGLEFGYRDNPDTLRRSRTGHGWVGGRTRRYGEELYYGAGRRNVRGYDSGYGPAQGMRSNRARGVYGSDYRAGERNRGEHGGYRGNARNRGGGMNPGRYGGWS